MAFSASIKLVVEGMTDLNVGDIVFLQRKTIFKIEMFVVDIQIEFSLLFSIYRYLVDQIKSRIMLRKERLLPKKKYHRCCYKNRPVFLPTGSFLGRNSFLLY